MQEGAQAYLNRQYQIIAGVARGAVRRARSSLQNIEAAIGFAIGGLLPAAAGFIGMNVSVRANARVAEAARGGMVPPRSTPPSGRRGHRHARRRASRSSASPATTASSPRSSTTTQKDAVDALVGLGFGGSLISVFARLGGGIFTKAADVGADLVGKIEAGIPEDDPRNPAVIADNVGDNVGDCAGMAADLFETYAVTAVAVMLLGVLTFGSNIPRPDRGGRALPARARRRLDHRLDHRHLRRAHEVGNVERALYQGLIVSGVIAAAAFYPITQWLMDDLSPKATCRAAPRRTSAPASPTSGSAR